MNTLWQDLRYGTRLLAKSPGVTAAAVLSLALGIGANVGIFSFLDAAFLRHWAVRNVEELVRIFAASEVSDEGGLSYPDYLDLKNQTSAFSSVIAIDRRGAVLTPKDKATLVAAHVVTSNYFSGLGVSAEVGRLFREDDPRNLTSEPVVVISHSLWQRQFGSDPSIAGRTIQINEKSFTVSGVAPRNFRGLFPFVPADLFVPFDSWLFMSPGSRDELLQRGRGSLDVIARLRPGATPEVARAQVRMVFARLASEYPSTHRDTSGNLVSVNERQIRRAKGPLLLFSTFSCLIVLIAFANVAILLLARAESRRREIAVRTALGSSRARLIRQALTESVLLAVLGGVAGLFFASWLIDLFPALMPAVEIPVGFDFKLDGRVLQFGAALTLLAGILTGLVPSFRSTTANPSSALKDGDTNAVRASRTVTLRDTFVVGQVALSVVLLTACGLLLKSYSRSRSIPLGIERKNMLLLQPALGLRGYGAERTQSFYERLAERVRALPGVTNTTFARRIHLGGSGGWASVKIFFPGRVQETAENPPNIKFNSVGPGYFRTMGTRILRGRDFDTRDGRKGAKVVLVSESMARRFWPGEDPIGRTIRIDDPGADDREIVGVTEDGKYNQIHEPPEPYLYFPYSQLPRGETTFVVETTGDPLELLGGVRSEIGKIDPSLPLLSAQTLADHLQFASYGERTGAIIASALALLGLLLASTGLYSVVSFAVSRRTREIGLRMSLGATRSQVLCQVLKRGLRLALVGAGVGSASALAAARLLSSYLHGVRSTDPAIFAAVFGVAIAVSTLACYMPARRAARVDPLTALRYE